MAILFLSKCGYPLWPLICSSRAVRQASTDPQKKDEGKLRVHQIDISPADEHGKDDVHSVLIDNCT